MDCHHGTLSISIHAALIFLYYIYIFITSSYNYYKDYGDLLNFHENVYA